MNAAVQELPDVSLDRYMKDSYFALIDEEKSIPAKLGYNKCTKTPLFYLSRDFCQKHLLEEHRILSTACAKCLDVREGILAPPLPMEIKDGHCRNP